MAKSGLADMHFQPQSIWYVVSVHLWISQVYINDAAHLGNTMISQVILLSCFLV